MTLLFSTTPQQSSKTTTVTLPASFNQLVNTSAITESAPNLQAPQLTSSSTSLNGDTISLNFSEELFGNLDNNTFQVVLNGRDRGFNTVIQTVHDDGSSTIDIKLFSHEPVGQGESLVVSYDPAFSSSQLVDSSGNPVDAFQQAVNNSSTAAPQDFDVPQVVFGSTYSDGGRIFIAFDEQLQETDTESLKSALRIVVDGHELPSFDAIETLSINNFGGPEAAIDGTGSSELFITLGPDSVIKQGQSVFVSYDMDMAMAFAPAFKIKWKFVNNFMK